MHHQIWVGGNTLSDMFIASMMLFHVSYFRPLYAIRDHSKLIFYADPAVEKDLG